MYSIIPKYLNWCIFYYAQDKRMTCRTHGSQTSSCYLNRSQTFVFVLTYFLNLLNYVQKVNNTFVSLYLDVYITLLYMHRSIKIFQKIKSTLLPKIISNNELNTKYFFCTQSMILFEFSNLIWSELNIA